MPATYVTTTIISSPNMRTAACVIAIFTLDTGVANKYAIALYLHAGQLNVLQL